jgi:chromosome partitioning protein
MILAVASQKGGAAKTTTVIHLGAALAQSGRRVLIVDMDPQGHAGECLGVPSQELDEEISQVLEEELPLPQIINQVRPNLDLAPANLRLANTEYQLVGKYRREDRLKRALLSVDGRYDDILIDTPPSLGLLTVNALSAAQTVLIPLAADYLSMLGVSLMLQTILEIRKEINPQLKVVGIVATRVTRTTNAHEVLERVREELKGSVPILSTHIPETVRFREAAGLGKTIFEHAPDSPGATAYLELAREVSRDG